MAPANRPPSRSRRKPAVAGTRGPGVDRASRPGDTAGDTGTTPDDAASTAPASTASAAATPSTPAPSTDDAAATADATTTPEAAAPAPQPGASRVDVTKPRAKDRPTRRTPSAAKAATTSAAEAATTPAADDRPTADEPAAVPATGRFRGRSRPVTATLAAAALLLVAAVVVGVVALVVHGRESGTAAPSSNVALTDAGATSEASAATVTILQTAYSYSWTTIDADLDAAVALMTPEMATQHRASFDTIRQTVTDSKTTTKATVVSNGVRLLDGDRAEAIAFVTVAGDNDGTALQTAGYRFTADLLRVDGQWKLSGLTES